MIDELLIPREVLIPSPILEEIRSDGRQEARRGWEAVGLLSGTYDASSHQISVSQRYHLYFQSGKPTCIMDVYDFFVKLTQLPRVIQGFRKSEVHMRNSEERGLVPAELWYHTHPFGSWSGEDMRTAETEIGNLCQAAGAFLLYKAAEDQFEAIDGKLSSIPVSTLT